MNILHINSHDLHGARFNGYEMQYITGDKHHVEMAVWEKASLNSNVHFIPPGNNKTLKYFTSLLITLTARISFDRLFGFAGIILPFKKYFKNADILHLHLIHNYTNFSILSLPKLSRIKPLVWTIHDPWAMTGGCEHSFDCNRWKNGCSPKCPHPRAKSLFQHYMPYVHWRIKKSIYKRSQITLIVASQWMQDRIAMSPLLSHFPCHRIPFGVDINLFRPKSKMESRNNLGIPANHKVIAFRDSGIKSDKFKGLRWLKDALDVYKPNEPTTLLIIQDGKGFLDLSPKYNIIMSGWVDGEKMVDILSAADVFVMPSIQESFGLMAIEAMACGTPVIVFEGTALPSVIKTGGLVVPTKDSRALAESIELLIKDNDLRKKLGKQARQIAEDEYSLELYVNRHLNIYEKVIDLHKNNCSD